MSQLLPFDAYLATIRAAATALLASAGRAGLDSPVPTCPDWRVRDLLIHQGIIHRWATELVAGRASLRDAPLDEEQVEAAVSDAELPGWLEAGSATLVDTLETVDPEAQVPTFLANPPRPREFWARRQAHETTIHCVDALAAALGRVPCADEVVAAAGPDVAMAADGIDEILRGFFSRGHKSKLYDGVALHIAVAPTDHQAGWIVEVDDRGLRVLQDQDASGADAVFRGSAAQLYLGLWNRGNEITASGDADLLERWRDRQHVTWA